MEKRRRKIENLKAQLNIETNMHLKISEEEQLRREKLEQQCIFYDKNYEEQYLELNILGEGCVGQVKKVQKISNNKYFASKMVHTNDEEKVNQIIEEFLNCKKLEHPNIVKVYELHIDTNNEKIYTIMEYIAAKQMFSVIHRIKSFNENIASNIFKQILLGIKYMHEQGVCHRDLKPNNILVTEDGLCVKITDFNISKFGENKKKTLFDQQDTVKMWTYTGTVAFTAPEVFDGQYNQGVDLWSAGVVLYCMLSGVQPFESEYVKDLIYKIQNDEVKLTGPVWDNISKDAKQLISLLLQKNPKNRPTINKALLHPFITKKQNSSPLTDLAFQNMKSNLQKLLTKYDAFQELGIIKPLEKRKTFGIFNHIKQFNKTIDSLKQLSSLANSDNKLNSQQGSQIISQNAVDEKFQNNQQLNNNNINDGIQLQSKYGKKQDDYKFEIEPQNFFESPHRKRYNSLILHDRYSLSEKKMISYYQQIQNMFSKNDSIENSPKNYQNKFYNETSQLNGKFKKKKSTEIQGIQFDGLESDMNLSDQENEENMQNFKDTFTDFKDIVTINNNSEKQAKFQQIQDLTPINAFRLIGQNVNTIQQQQNQQIQKQVKVQNFQEQVQFQNQQQKEILQNIQQIKNDNDFDDAENMGIEVRKRSNSMNNIRISLSKKSVILRKKKASVQIQYLTSVALPDSQQFEEQEQNKCNNNEKKQNENQIKKIYLDKIKKQSLLMIQSKGQYNEDKSSYSGSNSNSESSSICQSKSDSCFDSQSSISQEQVDEAIIQKEQPILDKITTM